MKHPWIITYHHRHGTDAFLYMCEGQPDLDKVAEEELDNFEPDQDEYLETHGILDQVSPVVEALEELVAAVKAFDPAGCDPAQPNGGRVAKAEAALAPFRS